MRGAPGPTGMATSASQTICGLTATGDVPALCDGVCARLAVRPRGSRCATPAASGRRRVRSMAGPAAARGDGRGDRRARRHHRAVLDLRPPRRAARLGRGPPRRRDRRADRGTRRPLARFRPRHPAGTRREARAPRRRAALDAGDARARGSPRLRRDPAPCHRHRRARSRARQRGDRDPEWLRRRAVRAGALAHDIGRRCPGRAPAAGTGKTLALTVARDAWEADGVRVFGTALAARAAVEMEALAGIDSTTIARLMVDIDQGNGLGRGSVLVVDEAGMVGSRTIDRSARARETRWCPDFT